MFKIPPRRKLQNLFFKTVTLTKFGLGGFDDPYGQQQSVVARTYILKAEIQEITSEDLAFFVSGTVHLGDAWGFFFPSYVVKGQTIEVTPEDQVTWKGKTWRVDTIEDYTFGEHILYRRALMKRVI